jgi:hypothetical protein
MKARISGPLFSAISQFPIIPMTEALCLKACGFRVNLVLIDKKEATL